MAKSKMQYNNTAFWSKDCKSNILSYWDDSKPKATIYQSKLLTVLDSEKKGVFLHTQVVFRFL